MDTNAATIIEPQNAAQAGGAKPHYYGAFGSWLEALTRLNEYREAIFDIIFYDTDNLSQDEVNEAAWLYSTTRKGLEIKEGDVFVVKPRAWGGRGVERVSIDDLGDHCQGHGVAVAVPGVASSSIGAVSFARTVANGLQKPAVAIVAGRGWSDVLSEGLSGAFMAGFAKLARQSPFPGPMLEIDAEQLLKVLRAQRVDAVVGHSKGSAVILNTLRRLNEAEQRTHADLRVITFGCMIMPPLWVKHLDQYLGTLDPLGLANTSIVFWRSPYQLWNRFVGSLTRDKAIDPLSRKHVRWQELCGHRIGSSVVDPGITANEFTALRRALLSFAIAQPVDVETILSQCPRM